MLMEKRNALEAPQPEFSEPLLSVEGAADPCDDRVDEACYSQPGALFGLMSDTQKQTPIDNTARLLAGLCEPAQSLYIEHCTKFNPGDGQGAQFVRWLDTGRARRLVFWSKLSFMRDESAHHVSHDNRREPPRHTQKSVLAEKRIERAGPTISSPLPAAE